MGDFHGFSHAMFDDTGGYISGLLQVFELRFFRPMIAVRGKWMNMGDFTLI
jgi:hypothetical protein